MYEYIFVYIVLHVHCTHVHVHLNILDKVVSSLYSIFGTPCIYMFNDFRVRYDSNMQYILTIFQYS
jgi:hypothetical protein